MIRYLEKEEFNKCIPLWREAFPEDSEGFLEYYFGKKVLDSRILVKERPGGEAGTDGRILTMAHLNPYEVMVRGRVYTLPYIVGVVTAADSRHQGHMRDVFMKMLQDMHEDGTPFCYLMPASPDIYRPFGFTFVFDQPELKLLLPGESGGFGDGREAFWKVQVRLDGKAVFKKVQDCPDGKAAFKKVPDCPDGEPADSGEAGFFLSQEQAAEWMNRWLKKRYQVYALRDAAYLDMLQAELDSEDGHVWAWLDDQGELAALQAFWGLDKQEQRFLYCDRDEWTGAADDERSGCADPLADGRQLARSGSQTKEEHPARPGIMARITDVKTFAGVITVNDECPCPAMDVLVRIHDRLISGNDGLWRWRIGADGSALTRRPAVGTARRESGENGAESGPALVQPEMEEECLASTEVLDITIENMTSWLMGYSSLDSLMEADGVAAPFWCRFVRPLEGIFLDEVV